jgi:excinuclease UvrABC ATPase subunit
LVRHYEYGYRTKKEKALAPTDDVIFIKGARVHNLKNVDVAIPV